MMAGPAIDLATGEPVTLKIARAGTAADQLQWTLRCDRWRTLQHGAIARLLDFGLTGESDRFEAWHCGAQWTGARDDIESVSEMATAFLQAAGMSVGTDLAGAVHHGPHGPVVVPDTGTGYPNGSDEPVGLSLSIKGRGLSLIPRPAVAALGEMAEHGDRTRSRIAVLWGPAGSGKVAGGAGARANRADQRVRADRVAAPGGAVRESVAGPQSLHHGGG